MPDDTRVELAEDRTDYAEDRTLLAAQRTYGAFLRTGLGAVAVALGVQALLRQISPNWPGKMIATVFCACAILLFVGGFVDFLRARRKLEGHTLSLPPVWLPALLSFALALAAAGTGAAFWAFG
jgi:putative membrane protein